MKRIIIFSLLFAIYFGAVAQPKKRGRVKRKYRNVEQVSQGLPQVVFRGLVRDAARNPIPGASVEIDGLTNLVHSNEFGQFMVSDLPTGRLRLRVSCLGYQTKTVDYVLQTGYNDHYIALNRGPVSLETEIATAQKREQQISDIPTAVSVFTNSFSDKLGISDLSELAVSEPALSVESFGAGNSVFSLWGGNANSGFPEVSPAVAVFADNVPLSQRSFLPSELFDIERVEVVKGPQNVLFGREALNGAVHFISKKPNNKAGGYIRLGAGNFQNKEVQAAYNYPVIKDVLFVRAAGIYRDRKGYVDNTFGGTLSGKNVLGGRFSVRFLPAWNHKIDLQMNYRKSSEPGIGFLNRWIPNEDGDTGLFNGRASLNRGKELGSEAEMLDAALTYRLFRDEHNYWTSVTSFRKSNSSSSQDFDGTSMPALDMDREAENSSFFQEIRYNFVRASRTNGSIGVNYFQENGNASQMLFSNDSLISRILSASGNFQVPEQSRFPVFPQSLDSNPMGSVPLTGEHIEATAGERKTQTARAFLHYTYQWRKRVFFTLGASAVYDRLQLLHESEFTGGEPSALGAFLGASPNLLYAPTEQQKLTKNSLSFTGQAGATFRWTENFNFYMNIARGRKPEFLQYSWDGKPLVVGAEKVYSGETGLKAIIMKRIFLNANGFYRRHFNVQTLQWLGAEGTGLLAANGKATSYGAETSLRVAVIPGLDLFGNYAWMQSAFDSTGVDGKDYLYAGKNFSLAPEHSFSAGFSARVNIARTVQLFATPWYAWKSHYWFTEANIPGLDQPAFGILNANLGFEMSEPNLVLSVYGTNLLEQKYISSAGHWGAQFGLPTFIPGSPRIVGMRVTWNF
ncbi:TonB-dependent receptor [Mariniphaga anaerophila]|nr:TonB-dependent receptor plug domain-containing protein [Mariniphaga anaerophila]